MNAVQKHGTSISWTHQPGYRGETWTVLAGCELATYTGEDGKQRGFRTCKGCYVEQANTHKNRWLRVMAAAGIEPEIIVLETCNSRSEMQEAERFHIEYWRFLGARLTNGTTGGDGVGGPMAAETKEKIRRALTGKPKSEAHRLRSATAQKGRQATDETKAKLRAVHSTRKRSPWSREHRIALRDGRGGRAIEDQTGRVYDSQNDAARILGLNLGHINEVLHGTRRTTGGFTFRFVTVAA